MNYKYLRFLKYAVINGGLLFMLFIYSIVSRYYFNIIMIIIIGTIFILNNIFKIYGPPYFLIPSLRKLPEYKYLRKQKTTIINWFYIIMVLMSINILDTAEGLSYSGTFNMKRFLLIIIIINLLVYFEQKDILKSNTYLYDKKIK
ncbi:hypothetical protein SAMN05192551_1111 [Tindallia magadiensis]|uniref:Uncharacterized protein n=1 Tax=Tindallia magadiensis TaxID=69895 RepID=A0A1I3GZB6_9FIRM|nr:hypothetical protein SAMN05192551_1111 [Tindallia magadiensis]